jgi:metal-dependent amidase/aminoacylase/carboxypeptidase family protein
VKVTGKGGHGATPHECVDPVVAIVGMVQALQTIIPRNVYALDEAVISVTMIHTGSASNIIPEDGTFRRHDPLLQAGCAGAVEEAVPRDRRGHAAAYGVTAVIDYDWGYPATINHEEEADFAADVAREVVGRGCGGRADGPRDGVGGFQLHAGSATGGLSVPWHRAGGGAAPSGFRLQRRGGAGGGQLLRAAGGAGSALG